MSAHRAARDAAREYARSLSTRMHPSELELFTMPRRLRDLPKRRPWPALVAQAEADGLVCSPGTGPWWVLTDLGRRELAKARRAAS